MDKPMFTEVIQIAFVVENLEKAVRIYADKYGIRPWKIYTINSKTVKNLVKYDNKTDFSYKVAMSYIGSIEWELVEPLDERSMYSDFVKNHGYGFHHIAFGVKNFDKALLDLKGEGGEVLQSGDWQGTKFVHISTEDDLGFVVELFKFPKNHESPEPEKIYPKKG